MAASEEVLKSEVVGEVVRSTRESQAVVDEVEVSYKSAKVYVKGQIDPKTPPNRLTEKMADYGFRYSAWGHERKTRR